MATLNGILGNEKATRLANVGLDKVAAARLRTDGHDVPESLDLPSAIRCLGTNVFLKNAEYRSIAEGLIALSELTRGE